MNQPSRTRLPNAAGWWVLFTLVNVPAGVMVIVCAGSFLAVAGCLVALGGTTLLVLRVRATVLGLQESLADCSQQRAQLQAVVDTAGDAILTCDADGRVISANGSASRLFGWRATEFPNLAITRLLPSAPLGEVGTNTYQILGAAAAAVGRRKNGTSFPVTVSISKVRVKGQKLYLAIIHDLTDLVEARRLAEESSRGKSAFLRHMSHELRTPLNGILGMASALSHTGLDSDQARLLGQLAESGESLLAVLEQVLDFSRLETGDERLENRPFSLRKLLAEAVTPLAPLAAAKGLRLGWHAEDAVPDALAGDPRRLQAILVCLLGNAVKFTAQGEVILNVRDAAVYAIKDNKKTTCDLRFSVKDTGTGISRDEQERIFLPFEQGERRAGGVGLGLSIASRLAVLLGGELTVESEPGTGTTFHARLPFAPSRKVGRPVLVALRDASERGIVENVLRGLGLMPTGVSTGRAALAELARGVVEGAPFGLAVLEHDLPDPPADDWLGQLPCRSGWDGPVLLLHDDEPPDFHPACVREALHRREAGSRLGDLVGRHLAHA